MHSTWLQCVNLIGCHAHTPVHHKTCLAGCRLSQHISIPMKQKHLHTKLSFVSGVYNNRMDFKMNINIVLVD